MKLKIPTILKKIQNNENIYGIDVDPDSLDYEKEMAGYNNALGMLKKDLCLNHPQGEWFTPKYYRELDIRTYLLNKCKNDDEKERTLLELSEFQKQGLEDLLRFCVYFVDKCNADNLIIGVGRGSSVSSFVLYLIGIHQVDSLKYDLDYKDFFGD